MRPRFSGFWQAGPAPFPTPSTPAQKLSQVLNSCGPRIGHSAQRGQSDFSPQWHGAREGDRKNYQLRRNLVPREGGCVGRRSGGCWESLGGSSGWQRIRGSKEHISVRWQSYDFSRAHPMWNSSRVQLGCMLELVTHPSFHLLQESLNCAQLSRRSHPKNPRSFARNNLTSHYILQALQGCSLCSMWLGTKKFGTCVHSSAEGNKSPFPSTDQFVALPLPSV